MIAAAKGLVLTETEYLLTAFWNLQPSSLCLVSRALIVSVYSGFAYFASSVDFLVPAVDFGAVLNFAAASDFGAAFVVVVDFDTAGLVVASWSLSRSPFRNPGYLVL
jgi:hypothetical protein